MPNGFIDGFVGVAVTQADAPAIVDRGRVIRYGELAEWVARLGSALVARGVGSEDLVALALPKSADYVVAMLACWYTGAAFVPLAPDLPRARRADYLSRARPRLAIGDLAAELDPSVLCLSVGAGADWVPPAVHDPERLAYVIFTSGSSGRPKGVAVTHRGIVPMLVAQNERFGLGPGERSLWLLSAAFDASISDIGTALLSGATLYIEAPEQTSTIGALVTTIERRGISYIDLPPAVLAHLPAVVPRTLASVTIGGEVANRAAVQYWASKMRLTNVYGPTEATVCTSSVQCHAAWHEPLLGRELPGVRYAVLDAKGASCETGQVGELYISGSCLARGYHNAPQLTAERFVNQAGQRAYRTGDRVFRNADGQCVFVGRIDRQLKVGGALVAPEEIEARLLEQEGVERVAVLVAGARGTLTAFFEGDSNRAQALREALASQLPAHMVPSRFVCLPRLPTTESGKLDLNSLEAFEPPRRSSGTSNRAIERTLQDCFSRVLGQNVGTSDDFFASGGNSLRVIELVALAAQTGLGVHPAMLSVAPTPAALAGLLERDETGRSATTRELRHRLVQSGASGSMPPCTIGPAALRDALFLTGATGFLGARLLYELLHRTASEVLCLVRSSNQQRAMERIKGALAAQGLELPAELWARIKPILGDLTRSQLGLDAQEWCALANTVRTVVHAGAHVSLMESLDSLWPTNVLGTQEVLNLVRTGRSKAVHYVSTLAVFVSADDGEGEFREGDALGDTKVVYGGYAQSKWAAEVLVRQQAMPDGVTFVHRLGLLTGDSATGLGARQDWLALTLRGLAGVGAVPRDASAQLAMDATPIDYVARSISWLVDQGPRVPGVYTTHLASPKPVTLVALVAALRSAGVPVESVDASAWLERTAELLAQRVDPDLAAACLALRRACPGASVLRELDLFQATRCRFDDRGTRQLLTASGITCPVVDTELLARYVRGLSSANGHNDASK